MTDKAKELLVRVLVLSLYVGGFLLMFASCSFLKPDRKVFSECVKEQIDTATENWNNHPGPGDGRNSKEILRFYIVYWCHDKGGKK